MTLRQQALSGMRWTAFASSGRQALQFVIAIILARLLSPYEFGLVGMIFVFTSFAALFSELGFTAALVQRKSITEAHRSSVFWANMGAGLALTLLMAAAAPLIARFYDEPALVPITTLIAFNFVLGALNDVQAAILQREMNFRVIAIAEVGGTLVGGVVAIGMALAGLGVWSLVANLLVYTAVEVLLLWRGTDWRPRLLFVPAAIRELLGFSLNLFGFNVFNYWVRNLDNLLIGRFVGPDSLGLYSRAYTTMLVPVRQITRVMGRVLVPALARIQDDHERSKRLLLRSHRGIALLSMPLMCGLLVVADSFVLTLFGPHWAEMVPVLQILCVVAITQPLGATMGWVYQSQGRTDIQFRWALLTGAVMLTGFFIGVQWGIIGVALAYLVSSYLLMAPGIMIPGRLIGLGFGEFLRNLAPVLACTLVMSAAVWLLGTLLPADWMPLPRLLLQSGFGAALYLLLLHLFRVRAYSETRELLLEQLRRPPQTSDS